MQTELEIPLRTIWNPLERKDFADFFTVEIYGEKGWEVVNCSTSWKDASDKAEKYICEYQTRITSPRKGR